MEKYEVERFIEKQDDATDVNADGLYHGVVVVRNLGFPVFAARLYVTKGHIYKRDAIFELNQEIENPKTLQKNIQDLGYDETYFHSLSCIPIGLALSEYECLYADLKPDEHKSLNYAQVRRIQEFFHSYESGLKHLVRSDGKGDFVGSFHLLHGSLCDEFAYRPTMRFFNKMLSSHTDAIFNFLSEVDSEHFQWQEVEPDGLQGAPLLSLYDKCNHQPKDLNLFWDLMNKCAEEYPDKMRTLLNADYERFSFGGRWECKPLSTALYAQMGHFPQEVSKLQKLQQHVNTVSCHKSGIIWASEVKNLTR